MKNNHKQDDKIGFIAQEVRNISQLFSYFKELLN